MKKYLSICLALVAVVLTGCGSGNGAQEESHVAKIKEAGKLVLLTEATFPPFEYQDSSDKAVDGVAGVDIEFGKLLAEKLGVELEVLNLDFGTLVPSLQSGKGDLIAAGMSVQPDRAAIVDFSTSYYENGLYIIVPANSDIATKDDLVGKSIAVQQGTTANDIALGIENSNVMEFKGMVEAGLSVASGRSDASIADLLPATVITKNEPSLKVLSEPLTSESTALAVPKGSDFIELVNETIKDVKESGQLQAWFDQHYDAVVIEE